MKQDFCFFLYWVYRSSKSRKNRF